MVWTTNLNGYIAGFFSINSILRSPMHSSEGTSTWLEHAAFEYIYIYISYWKWGIFKCQVFVPGFLGAIKLQHLKPILKANPKIGKKYRQDPEGAFLLWSLYNKSYIDVHRWKHYSSYPYPMRTPSDGEFSSAASWFHTVWVISILCFCQMFKRRNPQQKRGRKVERWNWVFEMDAG